MIDLPHPFPARLLRIAAASLAIVTPACGQGAAPVAAPVASPAASEVCAALAPVVDTMADAGPPLQQCIDSTPPGGTLVLRPGTYRIGIPLVLSRAITVAPAGVAVTAPACRERGDPRCPVLQFLISPARETTTAMPLTISGSGITLHHIVVAGARALNPVDTVRSCTGKGAKKSMAGGLDVSGDRVMLARSVFRDFGCYTAIQLHGSRDAIVRENRIVDNGTHDRQDMWADGLTVHDATRLTVAGNLFRDNTDVQLIFGGCRDCRISGNVLRHSGTESGGAFAGLMLHAWPNGATSGRYDGTEVSGNDIDCGAARRCGFGLLIGATPWYVAPTAGGRVIDNRIANALLGLSVNDLTGPMMIRRNRVTGSGGRGNHTSCGDRDVPAINVSPASRRFTDAAAIAREGGSAAGAQTYAGCLLNFPRAVG